MMNGLSEDVAELTARMWPIVARTLQGVPPLLQGMALADLTATWLATQNPEVRDDLLDVHVQCIRDLIPVNARIIGKG